MYKLYIIIFHLIILFTNNILCHKNVNLLISVLQTRLVTLLLQREPSSVFA